MAAIPLNNFARIKNCRSKMSECILIATNVVFIEVADLVITCNVVAPRALHIEPCHACRQPVYSTSELSIFGATTSQKI